MKSPPRTVQMGVGDQVRSFVAYMLDFDNGGVPLRMTDKRVLQNYLRWAEEWNVVPIPTSLLLAGLKKHPQVRHKRDRLLDANGRALKNENGTPIRPTYYTFSEVKAKPATKLPGKVPLTDLVPHEPLLSKPRHSAGASVAHTQPRRERERIAA